MLSANLFHWMALGTVFFQAPPASAFAPPKSEKPSPAVLKQITDRRTQLGLALNALRRQGVGDPFLAEVEVFEKAAEWIVRHDEFYQKQAGDWTLAALDRGLLRASQQSRGEAPWLNAVGQSVVRAYRSRVDGSVQPYVVTYPAEYGKNPRRKWRLDVVLHGRAPTMTEVAFIQRHADRPAAPELDWVQIDVYGRGNNAYRWAGESDVLETIENFFAVERFLRRDSLLDPSRLVLRGYSMGGAGTWHLGLHRPDRWRLLGPGAGFVTTRGYIGNFPAKLPEYQERCLHIYDAIDYAENAFNVPIVNYDGSEDAQKQAADAVEAKLKPLGLSFPRIIAPGLGHSFPAEWQQKAEVEYRKVLGKDREDYPRQVRFVTYTLKYPSCHWVELIRLGRHYDRASVDAEQTDAGFKVKSTNVHALSLALPPGSTREDVTIEIDGQKRTATPYQRSANELHVYLEKDGDEWKSVLPERLHVDRLRQPRKMAGLTGPIDDAFTSSFLCVRGTGEAWHAETQRHADANLARFQQEWSRFLRGELPVKNDVDVTAEDIAGRNLILFGDPSSNRLLEQIVPRLPLQWTREKVNGLDARSHVPVLIFPSPLAVDRYIVVNSGHTFHAPEFLGTNAQLYPRLGDYALLKLKSDAKDPLAVEVVRAGLFDEFWHPPAAPAK